MCEAVHGKGVPHEVLLLLEAWGPAEGGGHAGAQAKVW